MLDFYFTPASSPSKRSKDVELRVREESRKMALLAAGYRKAQQLEGRRTGVSLKLLLASLFSFL